MTKRIKAYRLIYTDLATGEVKPSPIVHEDMVIAIGISKIMRKAYSSPTHIEVEETWAYVPASPKDFLKVLPGGGEKDA